MAGTQPAQLSLMFGMAGISPYMPLWPDKTAKDYGYLLCPDLHATGDDIIDPYEFVKVGEKLLGDDEHWDPEGEVWEEVSAYHYEEVGHKITVLHYPIRRRTTPKILRWSCGHARDDDAHTCQICFVLYPCRKIF